MTLPEIDAVILDFDGVLMRSMELHALAYQLVLRPWKVDVPTGDVFRWEGARSETIIRGFLERAGHQPGDDQIERLADLKQRVFKALGRPRAYPTAEHVVTTLAGRGFPLALATGTRRENVPALAPELVPYLDHLVTQESYTRDKPDPEPYLTAAEKLGVPPARCLVVENAPRGVESAKRAGAFVVAVTQTLPRDELLEAHLVVDALEDVLAVVPDHPGELVRDRR